MESYDMWLFTPGFVHSAWFIHIAVCVRTAFFFMAE